MRLHRLEITAFGPFAGTETVDFDDLGVGGLYLIHGPTGAGKTSVLDAVCFALYGRVPGLRGRAGSLRSDHAPAELGGTVGLEVTLRGRRFRISRSPRWSRPKKRGAGMVEEQARVRVEERRDDAWVAHTSRHDEAGLLFEDLLGMTAEQFCQVVLLPQGDFARFLRADADERRRLLERLFAVEVFTDVERWLADRRTHTYREQTAARERVRLAVAAFAEAAGEALSEAAPDALPEWAEKLALTAGEATGEAERAASRAAQDLATATEAAEAARGLARLQARHAEALRRRAKLEDRAGEREELARALEAAGRAASVLPLILNARQRSEQAGKADTAAQDAVSRCPPLGPGSEGLEEADRARRDEIALLEGLRADAVRLREVTAELTRADREVAELTEAETELAALLGELPSRCDDLESHLAGARARLAERPALRAELDAEKARLVAAERAATIDADLSRAEGKARRAVDDAQWRRDRLLDVRQARIEGMAAELAAMLHAGEPCTVCGSPEHPSPAHREPADEGAGQDEEDAAAAAYDEALTQRQESAARVAELRAERDAVAAAAEGADASEAEALENRLFQLDSISAAASELEEDLERASAELEVTRDRKQEIDRRLAEARARRHELAAESSRLSGRLDSARGEDATLEARIDRLTHESALLTEAAEAVRLARTAAGERTAAGDAAAAAASEAGFGDVGEAESAAQGDVEGLRKRLREIDDEEAAVRELLSDPALPEAAARPAPDVAAAEQALAAASAGHTRAASALDRARGRVDRLGQLRTVLDHAVAAWRPAAERHRVAEAMAALATGTSADNRFRMRLSAYVLMARLEQVVAAANERLHGMSGGRYELVPAERNSGERRGGLGLHVCDLWTGADREPGTLSGGETFVTSLALALGLADVVTAQAGGVEMGTLFVDEGFGSLDDETFDGVLEMLDSLRDGGRTVGIVSHVAELRTRIPAQLEVVKSRGGSSLTQRSVQCPPSS